MSLSLTLLVPLLLATPSSAQSVDSGRYPELFTATTKAPQVSVGLEAASRRKRLADVDLDLLRSPRQVPFVQLNLFDDLDLVARFDHLESAYAGGSVWVGSVVGFEDSSVMFSMMGDVVSASINWGEELCQVGYAGNGIHWINLVDASALPPCGTDGALNIDVSSVPLGGQGGRAGSPDIDVMVVYSTVAKNTVGGTSSMQSRINLAITETNSAYTSSTATQQLVLVHTEEMVGYTEPSSFSQILYDLAGKTDGKMDNVHALRDQYGADCVSMICKNGQYCGIAYLMTNPSASFESSAFSVTNYSCMTGYYSFGHELGHNMGCAHDPQNAGSAAYWYSYGFRTSNNQYRTIMAYSPGTRVKRFSSPNITYNGYTMGTSSQDNARSLNDTSAIVAAWRNGSGGGTTGPVMTVPSLTAGTYAVFTMEDCDPNGLAYIYYSLNGTGPTSTVYGTADLSLPLFLLPQINIDSNGWGSTAVFVPLRGAGVTVWFQGVDAVTSEWSDNLQTVVN
jgi:hypothetical protein